MEKKKILRGLPIIVSAAAAGTGVGILAKRRAARHLDELDNAFDIEETSSSPKPENENAESVYDNTNIKCEPEEADE